jgi:hypothetical protein
MPQPEKPSARGVAYTRIQAARRANVSVSTIDRARRSEQLRWFKLNTRGVRIWSADLFDWIRRGMPLALLILVLGAALLFVACRAGFGPAEVALKAIFGESHPFCAEGKRHHHHHQYLSAISERKALRHGVRGRVKVRP